MKKHTWKIIGLAAVLLLGASIVYSNNVAKQANEGITFEPHVKGNAEAAVTLTEYSDFQCPACAQAFPVVGELVTQYGDKLRFEYKHFPLSSIHPFAVAAAQAAEAAGQQGKFFEMHDLLFENQSVWSNATAPRTYFEQYAEELGLDMDQFNRHLNASAITDKIEAEFYEARDLNFTGTPSFLLNGKKMEFTSYQDFIEQVEAAIGVPQETASTSVETSLESEIQFGI